MHCRRMVRPWRCADAWGGCEVSGVAQSRLDDVANEARLGQAEEVHLKQESDGERIVRGVSVVLEIVVVVVVGLAGQVCCTAPSLHVAQTRAPLGGN